MQEVSPEVPASIYKALGNTDDDALMTVAAFMLAAGARSTAKFFIEDELIGEEELEQLGLHDWWRSAEPFGKPPPIDEFREFFYAED